VRSLAEPAGKLLQFYSGVDTGAHSMGDAGFRQASQGFVLYARKQTSTLRVNCLRGQ
jgi:hypothetical protein